MPDANGIPSYRWHAGTAPLNGNRGSGTDDEALGHAFRVCRLTCTDMRRPPQGSSGQQQSRCLWQQRWRQLSRIHVGRPGRLFLGLAGFERFFAVPRAILEPGVTLLDTSASGHALRFLVAARFLAAVKFFGALVDSDRQYNHQPAGKREERQTCLTFHLRILSVYHRTRPAKESPLRAAIYW